MGELRYCPGCGRVGDVSECGPHGMGVLRRFYPTARHPDDAAQAAYRIGGLQEACEYLKGLKIILPTAANGMLLEPGTADWDFHEAVRLGEAALLAKAKKEE